MRKTRKPVADGLRLFWAYARRDLAMTEPVRLAALRLRLACRRTGARGSRP